MDPVERARRYVAAMEPSVSGARGHDRAFSAAVALVHGFLLPEADALHILMQEFNPRCSPPWSDAELRHKVASAGGVQPLHPPGWLLGEECREGKRAHRAPAARAVPATKRQEYDHSALERAAIRGLEVDERMLLERSPVWPIGVTACEFLDRIRRPGELTLVFTSELSQGDYGHQAPGKSWRLGNRPNVPARPADLPKGGKAGVWWLAQPVDGQWHANPRSVDKRGCPRMSRRSAESVTAWRYLLLESDEAPPNDWLNLLVRLPLAIEAIYTSGGRSLHALVRLDARSQPEWNAFVRQAAPILTKLGADGAAMSAVRLTRMPGCLRFGTRDRDGTVVEYDQPKRQELLYLAPDAKAEAIHNLPRRRAILASCR